MLRILKDGKAIPLKEQEKLCKEDRTQNVGPVYVPPKTKQDTFNSTKESRTGLSADKAKKADKDVKTK